MPVKERGRALEGEPQRGSGLWQAIVWSRTCFDRPQTAPTGPQTGPLTRPETRPPTGPLTGQPTGPPTGPPDHTTDWATDRAISTGTTDRTTATPAQHHRNTTATLPQHCNTTATPDRAKTRNPRLARRMSKHLKPAGHCMELPRPPTGSPTESPTGPLTGQPTGPPDRRPDRLGPPTAPNAEQTGGHRTIDWDY